MAAPQKQSDNTSIENKKTTRLDIKDTHTSEIVIALCGPIGSRLKSVASALEKSLTETFNYECTTHRLSKYIEDHYNRLDIGKIPTSSKYEKISALIDAGDSLREKYGNSVLAELAIAEISINKVINENNEYKSRRVCHIIDSIKNQAELDLLREIYRETLYVFGVFSSNPSRESKLKTMEFQRKKFPN